MLAALEGGLQVNTEKTKFVSLNIRRERMTT